MIMRGALHCFLLWALAGSAALFGQESPTPSPLYPNAPRKANVDSSGETGHGADYNGKAGYQYVDHFSGPTWTVDPNHPVDFEWPEGTPINDFGPRPRAGFLMMGRGLRE